MFKKIIILFFFVTSVFANDEIKIEIEKQMQSLVTNIEDTNKKSLEPKNTLYIELKDGIVVVELYPNLAPRHVQRIKELTKDGFYDNIKFHRVISGFMAQTGDPTGTGRGGSKMGRLYAEFNNEKHKRGILSMARAVDKDSANSQFFIVTGQAFPELDGQYTVFGKVIEGMEFVDKIKAGDSANNGMVVDPDTMIAVVTGDMLNDKTLPIVKEEIKMITEMQNEKIKEDKEYEKQPVLSLLLAAKDIDITSESGVKKTKAEEDAEKAEKIENEEKNKENEKIEIETETKIEEKEEIAL